MTTEEILEKAEKIRQLGVKLSAMERIGKCVSATSPCVEKAANELIYETSAISSTDVKSLLSYILTTGLGAHSLKIKEEMQVVAQSMAEVQQIVAEDALN